MAYLNGTQNQIIIQQFRSIEIKSHRKHISSSPTVSIFSSGSFTFPAHHGRGQGAANRQSFVLAGKLFFAIALLLTPLTVFNASADTDSCSLPRFFGDGGLFVAVHFCFVHLFQISPFFILRNKKRRMRAFHPPRHLDAKKILIRLFVIQFFFACRLKNPMT